MGAANPQHFANRDPPGFQSQLPALEAPPQANLEAMMSMLLKSQMQSDERIKQMNERLEQLSTHNKILKNQLANQASTSSTRVTGKLPASTENSREHVNAIVTRSSKILEEPPLPTKNSSNTIEEEIEKILDEEEVEPAVVKNNPQVHEEVEKPVRRDILAKKKKFGDHEMVAIAQEYRALTRSESRSILKHRDPGRFAIHVLLEVFTTSPIGILEDVQVYVDKYFVPCDFIVIDAPENPDTPIILGRPFLVTTGAIIDARKGSMIFDFGEEKVEFNVINEPKTTGVKDCSMIHSKPLDMTLEHAKWNSFFGYGFTLEDLPD
ncbi:PREDICTED: uncharacterized protein LOC109183808 [Ipomoea nil]|uniref:uncharacterized protein LOC109183808 n=1 Tax=Ipomoea nil TaxID=35883 RepID=UPI000901A4BB|nr:PREDICTED: uncharacterized protein LOC109183808 [Ipomoea nil]